jgi:hypothetical protein
MPRSTAERIGPIAGIWQSRFHAKLPPQFRVKVCGRAISCRILRGLNGAFNPSRGRTPRISSFDIRCSLIAPGPDMGHAHLASWKDPHRNTWPEDAVLESGRPCLCSASNILVRTLENEIAVANENHLMRAYGGVTLDEADWTKAARLYAEGLNLRQLGERFGVSSTTIRHGLTKRKRLPASSAVTATSATSTRPSTA